MPGFQSDSATFMCDLEQVHNSVPHLYITYLLYLLHITF